MEKALSIDVTVAAMADDERYIPWPYAGQWRITGIKFAPATAVALDASNYFTVNITVNDGAAGSDSSNVATFNTTTGGTALVLKTTVDLALTQVAGDEFNENYQLKIAKVETGTGAALDGCFVVTAEKIN